MRKVGSVIQESPCLETHERSYDGTASPQVADVAEVAEHPQVGSSRQEQVSGPGNGRGVFAANTCSFHASRLWSTTDGFSRPTSPAQDLWMGTRSGVVCG